MLRKLLKIGDVSKITGLAPETIRYYERQGILSPEKNRDSGYRCFSTMDVYSIIRIRAYMKLGFSMSQAKNLISNATIGELQSALLDRAEEVQRSISEQMLLLQTLYRRVQYIQAGRESEGRYSVRQMPTLLGLSMYDEQNNLDLSLPLEAWYNRQDITYPYCIFGLDENDQIYIDRMGMCVTEQEMRNTPLEGTANDRIESCPCLYTSAVVRDSDTMEKTQEIAGELIRRFPDTSKRIIIHRTIAALNDEKEGIYFVELWMPVSRACGIGESGRHRCYLQGYQKSVP